MDTFDAALGLLRALNEGRGRDPGDTRCCTTGTASRPNAQRRPGPRPRRHPLGPTGPRRHSAPLNEGRGRDPGDTANPRGTPSSTRLGDRSGDARPRSRPSVRAVFGCACRRRHADARKICDKSQPPARRCLNHRGFASFPSEHPRLAEFVRVTPAKPDSSFRNATLEPVHDHRINPFVDRILHLPHHARHSAWRQPAFEDR